MFLLVSSLGSSTHSKTQESCLINKALDRISSLLEKNSDYGLMLLLLHILLGQSVTEPYKTYSSTNIQGQASS